MTDPVAGRALSDGRRLHLGVALDGAGWHPGAWRDAAARPGDVFGASYWIELARLAERGGIDLLTIEDSFTLQSEHPFRSDDRTDRVRGRLDAALLATAIAPATSSIGLVPTITTTHTEPFHVSLRIATLDHVSGGRAGWRVQVARQAEEAALFGRRELPTSQAGSIEERVERARPLFDEAADVVEVARRLWDSWEDDAEIRDVATGRFIDRDKLHYVDFAGEWFSVRGPSITPRPPQGQPVVFVLAHGPVPYELAARSADVVLVTPQRLDEVEPLLADVRAAEARVSRVGPPLLVHAEVLVVLDERDGGAAAALEELDVLAGATVRSDAPVVAGTPAEVARTLMSWQRAGIDGVRLRPARLPTDLEAIVDGLVPELRSLGVRVGAPGRTLRERLGLGDAANRYASAAS